MRPSPSLRALIALALLTWLAPVSAAEPSLEMVDFMEDGVHLMSVETDAGTRCPIFKLEPRRQRAAKGHADSYDDAIEETSSPGWSGDGRHLAHQVLWGDQRTSLYVLDAWSGAQSHTEIRAFTGCGRTCTMTTASWLADAPLLGVIETRLDEGERGATALFADALDTGGGFNKHLAVYDASGERRLQVALAYDVDQYEVFELRCARAETSALTCTLSARRYRENETVTRELDVTLPEATPAPAATDWPCALRC